jgi:hypothetical protein
MSCAEIECMDCGHTGNPNYIRCVKCGGDSLTYTDWDERGDEELASEED